MGGTHRSDQNASRVFPRTKNRATCSVVEVEERISSMRTPVTDLEA